MLTDRDHTNSLGQRFVRIEAGAFSMGAPPAPIPEALARLPHRRSGDYDEAPARPVTISRPFYMAALQVTNAQYEQFDPGHRSLRGKQGFSTGDDEAVVFVSWHDAVAFCRWLSEKEDLPYRLPTEAEWEYACRAGTTTHFHTGDDLPEAYRKNAGVSWYPDPERSKPADVVSLEVGRTPPNPWGLCDMHGNVEEWCLDWHGPYQPGEQTDPVGAAEGDFRVTRGGSHSTEPYFLRSANRMGALPEERSWLIGFRVAIGETPSTAPAPPAQAPLCRSDVAARAAAGGPDPGTPYFEGPRVYVKIPPGSTGPLFSRHNHVPALVECPNGDLLASWYSCVEEPGREVSLPASRLRSGRDEWDPASLLWDAPDRTMASSALWFDGEETIYHFVGLSAAATWGNLVTVLRTSRDSGASWSPARLIIPEHGLRHMPIESVFRAQDGTLVLPCDAVAGGHGGTALWLSDDEGETWRDAGGTIAGIHAGVAQLADGRLLAFGRGDNVNGMMPMSLSGDMGRTWEYSASIFPPIHGGQRLVLKRLREGPLFFASYANEAVAITDASGVERPVRGLYCAVSFDDGATWPIRKLVSPDRPARLVETMDGYLRPMGRSRSEPAGYLACCQGANGVIHLISSRLHHAFNLAWLQTPPPAQD